MQVFCSAAAAVAEALAGHADLAAAAGVEHLLISCARVGPRSCDQARATGTSLSRVVAARERWPRRIRQAGARPQAAHCTVPLP